MTGYEVLAVRVGSDPHRTVGGNFFFDALPAPAAASMPQDYVFWLIQGGGRCVVVDTCFPAGAARGRRVDRPVEAGLAALGIVAGEVTDLVMTHLHWDHAGNLGLFPQARIHVQAAEVAFCTGTAMLHAAVSAIYAAADVQSLVPPLFEGRVNLVDGDVELFPGIELARVGGHTPGSQVVRVRTARGPVVLASDAVHFWANVRRRSPFPILESFPQALRAFDRVLRLAEGRLDRIIPGHDPLVRRVFPALPGHEGIACLHAEPLVDVGGAVDRQFALAEAA